MYYMYIHVHIPTSYIRRYLDLAGDADLGLGEGDLSNDLLKKWRRHK